MRRMVLLLLVACLLPGMVVVSAQSEASEARPVIVDSDMASDDWMALAYLLSRSDIAIQAITVTGTGFATCEAGVEAALRMVARVNYGEVPVSCWTDMPLMGENPVPESWRTTLETVEALGLPEGGEPAEENAVELFTSTVQAATEPITVLALGPLTNIAAALEATPSLVDNIAEIVVMGGAVDVDGSFVSEENTSAEWNIYADPHAARLTFESGVPITLVPLDATNETPVTPDFVTRLREAPQTAATEIVLAALANSQDSIEAGGYYFWDPLAAVVLTNPELVTLETRDVTVIDVPGNEYGRTKPVGNGPEIRVATAPDAEAFEQLFIDTLSSAGMS